MKSFFALMLVLSAGIVANAQPGDLSFEANSVEAWYYPATGELVVSTSPSTGPGSINWYVEHSMNGLTPLPGQTGEDPLLPGLNALPAATREAIAARVDLGITVALSNNASRRGLAGVGKQRNLSLGSIGVGIPMDKLSLYYQRAVGTGNDKRVAASNQGGSQFFYVPEPTSIGVFGLGLAGLLAARRRG